MIFPKIEVRFFFFFAAVVSAGVGVVVAGSVGATGVAGVSTTGTARSHQRKVSSARTESEREEEREKLLAAASDTGWKKEGSVVIIKEVQARLLSRLEG